MGDQKHKAGFVNIIGKPNVGKSTLMNALVGEKLSIITSKAQTTRHRIMGILNGEDFQIVYSDTPGIINPAYELHKAMMRFVYSALEDADVALFMTDVYEDFSEEDKFLKDVIENINNSATKVIFLLNKIDQKKETEVNQKLQYWEKIIKAEKYIPISALHAANLDLLFNAIVENLPEHPPYFPKDELTDKSERFFAAEIIREKIFLNYKKEVPYSTEVVIEDFKETEDIIRIRAEIYVERKTQRSIIIGKGGEAIKKVGIQARQDMEAFFGKHVYLEQYVRVEEDWRKSSSKLGRFGY
jgi:GTPase